MIYLDAIVFNLTTAALMVLMFKCGILLIGEGTVRRRPVPWVAIALTAVAVGAVVLQLAWSGAMDALDGDPRKTGWWRVVTSVFMQNGGLFGGIWNIVTLAVIAALAQWFWRGPLMLLLFAAGILLPQRIDALFGETAPSTDPRNFAGSSGATYFLAATLAAGLLLTSPHIKGRLMALCVPAAGLAMWLAQENGHGLVTCYGCLLGAAVLPLARRLPRPPVPATAVPPCGPSPAGARQ
ncbi:MULTISPECIES: hypothetical protein [Streptomyces]|uniref:DUF4395 domain-containing protein n=1 Tax=Streptomyces yunnanensis TaxID=156453 RepID=A0ABY8A6D5_9ACTN|nr:MULTISPECIES: hypothetical protein [Streptomyces]AJC54346.1 hypothetical protein GZL_01750 [Streptomyces sp. 769]WEB39132.1 hypothetical protein MOV08_07390 [Streptomyces yunnanensis]